MLDRPHDRFLGLGAGEEDVIEGADEGALVLVDATSGAGGLPVDITSTISCFSSSLSTR